MKDYGHYGNLAKEHWKRLRPRMYRELKKSGNLEQALQHAQERSSSEMSDLLEKGFQEHEAWELVAPRYVALPSEKDEPVLAEYNPLEPGTTE